MGVRIYHAGKNTICTSRQKQVQTLQNPGQKPSDSLSFSTLGQLWSMITGRIFLMTISKIFQEGRVILSA